MEVIEFLMNCFVYYCIFLCLRWLWERIKLKDYKEKAVFITGSSTGFGHGLAVKCLRAGMPVFAGCRSQAGIDRLKAEASRCNGRLHPILLDVRSDESVEKARIIVEDQSKSYGGLHAIVNNAGTVGQSFYDDFLLLEDYKDTIEVNLFGVIRVTKALGYLLRSTKGRIVNIISSTVCLGFQGMAPYTISKRGIEGYSEVLRQELRQWGISVHLLEPGFFKTNLISDEAMEKQLTTVWKNCPERTRVEYGERFFKEGCVKTKQLLHQLASDDVQWVVDTYFHAVTARFPRKRYQIGYDNIFGIHPLSWLPTEICDVILIGIEKLVGAPLADAIKKKKYN